MDPAGSHDAKKRISFMSLDIDRIIQHLWRPLEDGREAQVFALLDAARDDAIYSKLMASTVESVCLFRGENAVEMAHVAPYLVRLEQDDPFTHWVIDHGWGDSWGIFVESSATIGELKRHFRSILQVYDEEGNSLFFRYYDPRVLRVYLPTCNESELKIFFGEINRYVAEGEDGDAVIDYFHAARQLSQTTVQLRE